MEDDAKTLLLPVDGRDVRRTQTLRSVVSSALRCRKSFFFLLGPLLCGAICLWAKVDGPKSSRNMLAVLAWVLAWWVTEAVPLPIASLAPLFLFPLFGIASADEVASSYMDDVITMVLGSFIFALAVEQYNIHKRLALNITLLFCGEPVKPSLLILGLCATSAFVSMWMHNVAAAVLMMPMATGILQRFPSRAERDATVDNFCRAVVLAVVYSVAIGGMSTLTGTGVNLILVGMWKSYFPEAQPITFNAWLAFGLPLALLLLLLLWGILFVRYCSSDLGPAISKYLDKAHLADELRLLGPMEFAEKTILTMFSVLIALWMTRSITDEVPGWTTLFDGRVGDGTVSVCAQRSRHLNAVCFPQHGSLLQVMMATLLFIIPNMKKKGENLMDWSKCKKLPWNIILLLGAGLAIADGIRSTGLADVLSGGLDFLDDVPCWAVVPLVGIGSSLLTEFISSNNAVALLLLPCLVEVARTLGAHPLSLMVPGAVGAQFAFVLPTATPSNTVGFVTGHVEVRDMINTGFLLKVGGVLLLSLLVPTLGNVLLRLKRDANSP